MAGLAGNDNRRDDLMYDPVDMQQIIGSHNILFLTLDTLRFDAAQREFERRGTPHFARLFPDGWEQRHSPSSFTFGAHASFFAGFLPTPATPGTHDRLFALAFPGSETTASTTAVFDSADIVTGLAEAGYATICIGGVGFFNKLTPLGSALPNLFEVSEWEPRFGVTDTDSFNHQIDAATAALAVESERPAFVFVNVSALHQPNHHYLESVPRDAETQDSFDSHCAALRYVDGQLPRLIAAACRDRPCLVIAASDHGTAYGESGYTGHRIGLPVVWDVPYAHAVIETQSWNS